MCVLFTLEREQFFMNFTMLHCFFDSSIQIVLGIEFVYFSMSLIANITNTDV